MYTPIIGVLAYVVSENKEEVLLIHRNKKEGDDHLGKYNGLGGKMEPSEDVLETVKREVKEEAGIEATDIKYRGVINWRGFGKESEDWIGFIYRIDQFEGEVQKTCSEGDLEWVRMDQLHSLPMWKGDFLFLKHVFHESQKIFHGFIEYKGEIVINNHFSW